MMRIVEHRPDTTLLSYRMMWGLAVVTGVFSLIVAALMVANLAGLHSSDPIHTPALQTMLERLKASPQDISLKEQIRDLDLLARQAFFGSQRFNQLGAWLLAGGLTISLLAFKTLASFHHAPAYPDSSDPKDQPSENARWARKSVATAALVLTGMALTLALPWKSGLDSPDTNHNSTNHPVAANPAAASIPQTRPTLTPQDSEQSSKQWAGFRGPASGHSAATGLPSEWNGRNNTGIAWKTAVPLPGFGSPIVWGDRIFLSGADAQVRSVFCYQATDGKMLWRRDLNSAGVQVPKVTDDTGLAAPTMAADANRAFALFATGELAAFQHDGSHLWTTNLGTPGNPYGHGSSLVIQADSLFVQMDRTKESFVAAFNPNNGTQIWKTARNFGPSWSTPLLTEINGRKELILSALPFVVSYDPASGSELWRIQWAKGGEVVGAPVLNNEILYLTSDGSSLTAIDLKSRKILWQESSVVPGISTPLVQDGLLIAALVDGGIACLDAISGQKLWQVDTDDGFYASPLAANGRIHLLDRSGRMHIFALNRGGMKPVAKPELGEEAAATPAIFNNSFIIRGFKHLYRIGS